MPELTEIETKAKAESSDSGSASDSDDSIPDLEDTTNTGTTSQVNIFRSPAVC